MRLRRHRRRHQLPRDGHSGQGSHQAVVHVGNASHRVRRRRSRRAVLLGCRRLGLHARDVDRLRAQRRFKPRRDLLGIVDVCGSADTLAVLTADPYDPTEQFGLRASYVDGTIGAVGYDATAVREAVTTAATTARFPRRASRVLRRTSGRNRRITTLTTSAPRCSCCSRRRRWRCGSR